MSVGTTLAFVLACSTSTPNEPQSVHPVPSALGSADPITHYELVGRVTPGTSDWPDAPPFKGGKEMVSKCRERRPCAAERWRAEDGQLIEFTLIERTIYFEDGRPPWPARWMSITGVLRACIGDPLTIPPTDDLKSVRTLSTQGDTARWTLHFSGENSCGLEGQLRLDAHKDHIDLHPTKCEGKRWREGGRECAKAKLKSRR